MTASEAAVATNDDAYARWAKCYPPTPHNALMAGEDRAVRDVLSGLSPTRVLDVGTGSGRWLGALRHREGTSVVGLDRSPHMLARASALEVPLVRGDALALPFAAGSFDLVLSSLMVGDLEDVAGWALEVSRVLCEGGHVVYSDFHPSWRERGWTRTFTDERGARHTLTFWPHSHEHHRDACQRAGLEIIALLEQRLPADGTAATNTIRERWNDPAVSVVMHGRKRTVTRELDA